LKNTVFVFKVSNYSNRADIVTDLKVTDLLATNIMEPEMICFKLSWDAVRVKKKKKKKKTYLSV